MQEQMPHRIKKAVIREDYLAITGDTTEALLLNQLIYWSERMYDTDAYIAEERDRQQTAGEAQANFPLTHGWVYKSADKFKDEIMTHDSPRTINRKLDNLVSKGFVSRRHNPKTDMKFDRKYQYRVNFVAVIAALDEAGYVLEGYAKFFPDTAAPASEKGKTESVHSTTKVQKTAYLSKRQNDECICQDDESKRQDVKSIRQDVAAILEIIPETNLETISSPPISPPSGQNTPVTMEDDTGELDSFFAGMGLEQLRHREAVQWLKTLIADLWHTHCIGKEQIPVQTIREALGALTPQTLDSLFDRVYRQRQKGDIPLPELYVQRAILNAAQSTGFDKMARQSGGGEAHVPTYDMQDYIELSVQRLLGGEKP